MSVDVELTFAETMLAALVGAGRRVVDREKGRIEKNRMPDGLAGWTDEAWGRDVNATLCELAAAKALGRFWSGVNDKTPDLSGGIEVRGTSYVHNGHLLIQEWDADDRPFLLVLGPHPAQFRRPPWFTLYGWIFGRDGKRSTYRRDKAGNNRPCYWVPQEALNRNLDELPGISLEVAP